MTGITFLIVFLFLMILFTVIPQVLRKYHFPSVVSIMIVGIIIGPNALNLISILNNTLGRGYPTEHIYTLIDAIGLLGLLFLMALAGMEVSIKIINKEKRAVFWLSILTFSIPAIAGYFVYDFFEPGDNIGKWVYASLFASHSVGIVFPVIRELRVANTRFGIAVLAATIITDIASLVLFAICVQAKRHKVSATISDSISVFDHIDPSSFGILFNLMFLFAILAFIAICLWLLPKIAKQLFSVIKPDEDVSVTFFLVVILAVALIGELIGISIIVSVFIAGMALANVKAFQEQNRLLHHKIEGIGYGFVVPFLFLSIGMKTNLKVLLEAKENLAIVFFTFFGLVASKLFSGWFAMKVSGFDDKRSICAGIMTIPQLSATLAAAAVALQLNMISKVFFNAIVCLSILTTLPVPVLLKLFIKYAEVKFDYVPQTKIEDSLIDQDIDEDTI